jgi:two-component system sensor histidine kinase ChvG
LHFGIGLYVVRIIAKHHGGSVKAMNLLSGNGVTIQVTLPLYKTVGQVDESLD